MFEHIKQFFSSLSVSHPQDEYVFDPVKKFTCESVAKRAFDLDVVKHMENFIGTLDYWPSQNLRGYWEDILTTVVEKGYFRTPKPTEPHAWFIHKRLTELEKAGYLDYVGFRYYTLGPKMWH